MGNANALKKSKALQGGGEWWGVIRKGLTKILSRDLNEVRKQMVVEECSRQKEHQGEGPKMKMCCMCMCLKKQDSHGG